MFLRCDHKTDFLLLLACGLASCGCQDSRLAEQLKQADRRLEIASAQVEAASAQLAAMTKSLEQQKAAAEEASAHCAAQILETKKEAATLTRQIQTENTGLRKKLEETREELAEAQSGLDDIARQKAEAAKVKSALGVSGFPHISSVISSLFQPR
jgi:uncharacterized phage infection (PIP) family protein YhgE